MLIACGGGGGNNDDDDGPRDTGQDARVAQMRFVNLIPDAPLVDMLHDGRNSARFTDRLNFGTSSNRNDFVIGNFFFNFSYTNGLGSRITLYEESEFALQDGNEHSFLMIGDLQNAKLLRVDNPEFLVGLDDATADVAPQVQFVHAAVGIGPIDFYLTENGAALSTAIAEAELSFDQASPLFDVEASETLQLRAYPAGNTSTVLFDSGATPFARTTRSMIVAANYFGPSSNTNTGVELLRFGRSQIALGNANQPATLRVHNVIADENAVDVYLNDATGLPLIANVPFGERSAEVQVPAQTADLVVTAAGNQLNVLTNQASSILAGGQRHTLYTGGVASDANNSNAANLGITLAIESSREIAEGSAVRLFNGTTLPTALSIYLLRPGQTQENTTPSNLAMGEYAGIAVVSGEFDLVVAEVVNQSTIFGPQRIQPQAGKSLNIVIRDTFGGTSPVQVDLIQEDTNGL